MMSLQWALFTRGPLKNFVQRCPVLDGTVKRCDFGKRKAFVTYPAIVGWVQTLTNYLNRRTNNDVVAVGGPRR